MTTLSGYHRLRDEETKWWERHPPIDQIASHDAARLARTLADLTPFSKPQMVEFLDVAPTVSDRAVTMLCCTYRGGAEAERAFIRSRVSEAAGWILLTFSKRAAVRGLQACEPEEVRLGLIALAVENLAAGDVRDDLVALGLVYHCAKATHPDPDEVFEEAAQLAGPAIAAVLRDFIRRNDLLGIASAMGFQQVESRGRIGFRW